MKYFYGIGFIISLIITLFLEINTNDIIRYSTLSSMFLILAGIEIILDKIKKIK